MWESGVERGKVVRMVEGRGAGYRVPAGHGRAGRGRAAGGPSAGLGLGTGYRVQSLGLGAGHRVQSLGLGAGHSRRGGVAWSSGAAGVQGTGYRVASSRAGPGVQATVRARRRAEPGRVVPWRDGCMCMHSLRRGGPGRVVPWRDAGVEDRGRGDCCEAADLRHQAVGR